METTVCPLRPLLCSSIYGRALCEVVFLSLSEQSSIYSSSGVVVSLGLAHLAVDAGEPVCAKCSYTPLL